ncbi:MAG TPA: caspase family protein [Pyrinomonadaceae bacterium]|nr:caspase family protein [Pyrinomonadaceae bacterium]
MKNFTASPNPQTRRAARRRLRRLSLSLCCALVVCAAAFVYASRTQQAQQTRANETSRPELVLQTGHAMRVDGLAFSPDARLVASGSKDNTVRLWDTERAYELRKLTGHAAWVKAVAFSADGRWLASGSVDGTVKLWDAQTGRELKSMSGGGSINAVAFSPDAQHVAAGNAENSALVWNTQTGALERTLAGHTGAVLSVAYSPDGKVLATGGRDNSVKLWDTQTGRELHTLAGHAERVRALAFSPDGRRLASGSFDKTIKVWDVSKGREARTLTGHSDPVMAVAFTDGGRHLVSAGAGSLALVRWDAESGKQLGQSSDADSLETLEAATFSADGRFVASSNGDKTVVLRSVGAPRDLHILETRATSIYTTVFSPDGKWFASGSKDSTVRLWETATGRELRNLGGNVAGNIGPITSVAFSTDSRTLAAGGLSGGVKLWEVMTGRELPAPKGHAESVNAVAFGAQGTLATASNDRTIKLWDTATGRELRTLAGHGGEVQTVAFSTDGKALASASSNGEVKVWNAADGQAVQTLSGHTALVRTLAFSPDGKTLASAAYDKTVRLWDATSGQPLRTLNGADILTSVAFTKDGASVLAGTQRGEITYWTTATGQETRTASAHTDAVNALSFSRDGRWLISGSEDGSARVWTGDARGELQATLVSLRESADWLVVAPDGLFDGSPVAWNQILWRFEQNTQNVRPVEVFFNEYYAPGLLGEIFAGRSPRAAKDITQRDRRQPQVRLSLAAAPEGTTNAPTVNTRTARVRLEVAEAPADARNSAGSGAQDVRLFRNGLLVRAWRGDVLKQSGGGKIVVEADVPVVAGDNQLTAYAFNRDNVKSVDAELRVRGDESLRRAGTAYILAVGVNKYANAAFDLNFAKADAETFGVEVQKAQSRVEGFGKIEVVRLIDAESTKANLLLAIRRLGGDESALPPTAPADLAKLKRAQPEDTVIIYYAGHGIAQGQRFYIIPHDLGYMGARTKIEPAGMKTLLEHSLSDRELEAALDTVDAAQAALVLDACNSGQVLEAEDKRLGPMNSKGLAQLAYEKGMFILTAAQGYQAAKEATQLGHGLLTYALVVQGLKEGAADSRPRDGQVLMGEWLDYATERVPLMQLESMKQTRGLGLLGQIQKPLAFVDGEERIAIPENRSLQRPRVFYRRELAARPLVVTKVQGGVSQLRD